MFDYEKFENDIVLRMTSVLADWTEDIDDIYILSLDCSREMDSIGIIANTMENLETQVEFNNDEYWYYKYCEDEWELFDSFENISSNMYQYLEDNSISFIEADTYKYTEAFDGHCDKIIESCKRALVRFRASVNDTYPDLLLALNVREYLDEDERVDIFKEINNKEASEEYQAHVGDFC